MNRIIYLNSQLNNLTVERIVADRKVREVKRKYDLRRMAEKFEEKKVLEL